LGGKREEGGKREGEKRRERRGGREETAHSCGVGNRPKNATTRYN
jgi:hypothetical protein